MTASRVAHLDADLERHSHRHEWLDRVGIISGVFDGVLDGV